MLGKLFGKRGKSSANQPAGLQALPVAQFHFAISTGATMRQMLVSHYTTERGAHVETVIAGLGAICGQAAQALALKMTVEGDALARRFPDPPAIVTATSGEYFLFHEVANQMLAFGDAERPAPFSIIRGMAMDAGAKQTSEPLPIFAHTAGTVGSDPFPALTVPEQYRPLVTARQAIATWWPGILDTNKLFKAADPFQVLLGTAVAAGTVIQMAREMAPPEIEARLFMETAVASSKITGLSSDQGLTAEQAMHTLIKRALAFWA